MTPSFVLELALCAVVGCASGFYCARFAYRRGLQEGTELGIRDTSMRLFPLLAAHGVAWNTVMAALGMPPQRKQSPN